MQNSQSTPKSSVNPEAKALSPRSMLLTAAVVLVGLFLITALVAAGALYFYVKNKTEEPEPIPIEQQFPDEDDDSDSDTDSPADTSTDSDETPTEATRTPSEVDTSSWATITDSLHGISVKYPTSWSASTPSEIGLMDETYYSIIISDGNYRWILDIDPIIAAGNYAYDFVTVADPSIEQSTPLEIDGYEATMVNKYVKSEDLQAEGPNSTYPSGHVWGGGRIYTDPSDAYSLGFGTGDMYDEIDNNYWSISYDFERSEDAEPGDFSEYPVYGSSGLKAKLDILDAMTVSVEIE